MCVFVQIVLENSSREDKHECPFGRSSIELTKMLCEILKVGELRKCTHASPPTAASPSPPRCAHSYALPPPLPRLEASIWSVMLLISSALTQTSFPGGARGGRRDARTRPLWTDVLFSLVVPGWSG